MRIVVISDTHGLHHQMPPLPDGDLLIHAGDCTNRGAAEEVGEFLDWFGGRPHPHKVFIAGNHDFLFERDAARAESMVPSNVNYLKDSAVVVDGVSIWGSPWQPWFYDWAFNLERGEEIAAKWRLIPADADILVTHGPPHGILDQTAGRPPQAVGCEALMARLLELPRIKLHAFGHIHEAYGRVGRGGCEYVNASICDLRYRPINEPVVVDWSMLTH